MSLIVTKDRTDAILKSIQQMTKERVLIGVPGEKANRDPEPDDPKADITNPQIGYINEFGMPELNIPARPHIVPGVRLALSEVETLYRRGVKAQLDGNKDGITIAHNAVGLVAVAKVQRRITTGPFVALSPVTIKLRKAKGFKGEKPLIVTSQYRRSITYVIRKEQDIKDA